MLSCADHGSGIIIIIACGSERPASTSSSSVLSNIAESLPFRVDHRQQLAHVLAEQRRFEQALACLDPVDIAAHGIDLAVVRDYSDTGGRGPSWEKVLVLKRECTIARADSSAGFCRSGK